VEAIIYMSHNSPTMRVHSPHDPLVFVGAREELLEFLYDAIGRLVVNVFINGL
jgi:hypothetical protein